MIALDAVILFLFNLSQISNGDGRACDAGFCDKRIRRQHLQAHPQPLRVCRRPRRQRQSRELRRWRQFLSCVCVL